MSKSKIRIFAGPNGSGKSSLFPEVNSKYNCGCFINSDAVEKLLHENGTIDLTSFNLTATEEAFNQFLTQKTAISLLKKAKKRGVETHLAFRDNCICVDSGRANSYDAALITSFIREELTLQRATYSYETVFSHTEKLEELRRAKELGYRIYLYFIAIDDVSINEKRIEERVAKGGHHVPSDKVIRRYDASLNNLLPALYIADRAFLFDNSDRNYSLVAELDNGRLTVSSDTPPNWFIKYVVNKL